MNVYEYSYLRLGMEYTKNKGSKDPAMKPWLDRAEYFLKRGQQLADHIDGLILRDMEEEKRASEDKKVSLKK